MKSLAIIILTGAAFALSSDFVDVQRRQSNWTVGQVVQTTSGSISGHPATNVSQVSEYLGIPYAQAPIGDLRFAAPVKYAGTESLSGAKFGPSCPIQSSNASIPLTAIQASNLTSVGLAVLGALNNAGSFSEDCLYLNIWTKPQTGDAKKAVMVWIYGGGFSSGSSSIPLYNGANIVDQEDVVVVSFNYRVSILGFPGNPDGQQNLGFLDQRLAMEWVRDNIGNFGGDAARITLFGQSAGGASVDYYSYAWNSDPIAAGFIAESGTVFSWGLPYTQGEMSEKWYKVTATLGCGGPSSSSPEVMDCMRSKSYADILDVVPAPNNVSTLSSFGPTVDNTVVFSNYSERTPASIPLLIGNTDFEAGIFRVNLALQGAFLPEAFWDYFNLLGFTCPAGIRANVSTVARNPTWRYRYFGVFPDLALSPESGAWHASEVPLLFDTVPVNLPPTTEEESIAKYMRGAWATFAKNPVDGLTTYSEGWPLYNSNEDTLIRLAFNNITGTNLAAPSLYDASCSQVNVSNTNYSAYLSLSTPTPVASVTTAASSASSSSSTATSTQFTSASSGPLNASMMLFIGELLAGMIL